MAGLKKFNILLLLLSAFLFLYYFLISSNSQKLSISELELAEFQNFIIKHNKIYVSNELKTRYEIFKKNQRFINAFNALTNDFILAINKFADLTTEEFASLYTEKIKTKKDKSTKIAMEKLNGPPSAFDWRDKGGVSDVMNQGTCKSSWAIAATGAIEGARVAQGLLDLENLSVQEILDCATAGQACGGGLVEDAYSFVVNNGLVSDIVYPYTGKNQTCFTNLVSKNITTITGYYDVISNDPTWLINAVSTTPTISIVESNNYVWQFYYSGIVNNYCGYDVSHYVLVVGYNNTEPNPYFIVKNSWGGDWGESGYIRIGIQGGTGICGIQVSSSYPIF
ncbi:hypothetical protein SteCoe_17045 [Stentor coeruleus]|uniref:Peptidase C1A papain C-terminal domain-containing protein n=1 Tax=Stentor coeruleus TaxID=5963 RepID=A0A1R2BZU4_9CILI|nr:hypothetical protein SteCoe_17045 [Stentor coeruleus]